MKARLGLAMIPVVVGVVLAGAPATAGAAPTTAKPSTVVVTATGAMFGSRPQVLTLGGAPTRAAAAALAEPTLCIVSGNVPNRYEVPEIEQIAGEATVQFRWTASVSCNGYAPLRMTTTITIEVAGSFLPAADGTSGGTIVPGYQLSVGTRTHYAVCIGGRYSGKVHVEADLRSGTQMADFISVYTPSLGC